MPIPPNLSATGQRCPRIVSIVAVLLILPMPVRGQATAPTAGLKYRFYERYTTDAAPSATAIGQARVAFREKMITSTDVARGAPENRELTIQAIYRERPSEIAPTDTRHVVSSVRTYDTVRIEPAPQSLPGDRKPFEDLTIWYRSRANQPPEILVLTPDRAMIDREYLYTARQVFVPDLSYALPEMPIAVGETYRVAPAGMAGLLGGPVLQGELVGTLQGIQDDPAGGQVAVFEITGNGTIDLGPAAVRAQLRFAFQPSADVARGPGGPTIDAPGRIVRLSLAEQINTPGDGRLQQRVRRELVLERRADDPGEPIDLPKIPPAPTLENSWLVYADPQGRFFLRHPQELTPQPDFEADAVEFYHPLPGGGDVLRVSLMPREELNAEAIRSNLLAQWKADRLVVEEGESGWQPEADWPGMKTYRIQAVQMPPGSRPDPATARIYFDGYVVQTGRTTGLYAEASTSRTQPEPFRKLAETILKTFRFDEPAALPSSAEIAPEPEHAPGVLAPDASTSAPEPIEPGLPSAPEPIDASERAPEPLAPDTAPAPPEPLAPGAAPAPGAPLPPIRQP